ncbi:unnamed protein product [Rotaria socialis]|uniref:Uncharacterized protein n=1 Tax=Rotaria socialis TaxID=392032 RepID=A0A820TYF3_9BILA|nr:unnamed protein product [Rotaria socialis]CAF4560286.1 unnamed protein product [Rotaria socialis]CAF4857170.1 unnamed protein product [Rotaria socialis]
MAEDLSPSSPSEHRNVVAAKFYTALNGLTNESQKEITSLLLNENKSTAEYLLFVCSSYTNMKYFILAPADVICLLNVVKFFIYLLIYHLRFILLESSPTSFLAATAEVYSIQLSDKRFSNVNCLLDRHSLTAVFDYLFSS